MKLYALLLPLLFTSPAPATAFANQAELDAIDAKVNAAISTRPTSFAGFVDLAGPAQPQVLKMEHVGGTLVIKGQYLGFPAAEIFDCSKGREVKQRPRFELKYDLRRDSVRSIESRMPADVMGCS